jgi:hypothetical protein
VEIKRRGSRLLSQMLTSVLSKKKRYLRINKLPTSRKKTMSSVSSRRNL